MTINISPEREKNRHGSVNDLANYLDLVESGLRHTLRRNDLETLLGDRLDLDAEKDAQRMLKLLCVLLESIVDLGLLPLENSEQRKEPVATDEYPKLDALLVLLASTKWQFEIVTGTTLKLFKIKSLQLARDAKETVDTFNNFFTKLTRQPIQDFRPPNNVQLNNSVDAGRQHDIIATASIGLQALVSRLNDLPNCDHRILLQMLDPDLLDTTQWLSAPDVGLFLSDCQTSQWQWSLFNTRLTIDQRLWQKVDSLCDEIGDSCKRFGYLHLAFSDNDIFVCDQDVADEKRRQWISAGSEPSKTLKQLLKDYAFVPDVVKIPGSKTVFRKGEKRDLAARLVCSLATTVGSALVVKCWDAGSIYFLSARNSRHLQRLPYALCLSERGFKAAKDNQSREDILFPKLAKLLMEIECGFELPHIIIDCHDDSNLDKRTLEDVINEELEKDLNRGPYLEAVRYCLTFRATYEHMAKRMRTRVKSDDYFALARRETLTTIIKKIQQSSYVASNHKRPQSSADYEEPACPPISFHDSHLGISSGTADGCTDTLNLQSPTYGRQLPAKKVKFTENSAIWKQAGVQGTYSLGKLEEENGTAGQRDTTSPPDLRSVSNSYSRKHYSIGLICALPIEMAACIAMLDERHAELVTGPKDQNNYVLGKIGHHNVVIACLPAGIYGTSSAATVAMDMISSFQFIRFGLMVGIAGGVPSRTNDIRLGDVVVSEPRGHISGIFQYDMGKTLQGSQVLTTGALNKPPPALLTAVAKLKADEKLGNSKMLCHLEKMKEKLGEKWCSFILPRHAPDRLFKPEYIHQDPNDSTCSKCDSTGEEIRLGRTSNNLKVHYGPIASGNQVIRDSTTRDRLAQNGVLCFETEAAGLIDRFPCLVIRGICDYADSHKNDAWQGYAAATAAAFAKEVLLGLAVQQDAT